MSIIAFLVKRKKRTHNIPKEQNIADSQTHNGLALSQSAHGIRPAEFPWKSATNFPEVFFPQLIL